MADGGKSYRIGLGDVGAADVFKALGSETRLQIVRLLADGDKNINELMLELGVSQPTVTKHVQMLEAAGLVESEYRPGAQGMQKRCRLLHHQLIVSLEGTGEAEDQVEEIAMPVGLYTLVNAEPGCGLANSERIIGFLDDPQSFLTPERHSAGILWMAGGFVEYVFPCMIPSSMRIGRVELMMEVCSEAPNHAPEWPSDLTVWVNGVEMATWTSPGDLGGKRGLLNPDWWSSYMTQYGVLKIFAADEEGSYVDGQAAGRATVADLLVRPQTPVTVRIGVKPDAAHPGGFNLFGRSFGNYPQDLVLRLHYTSRESAPRGGNRSMNAFPSYKGSVPANGGPIKAYQ